MSKLFFCILALAFFAFPFSCTTSERAEPGFSNDILIKEEPLHFIHGYSAYSTDSLVNVVIEIPAGTLEKWEVDKQSGELRWSLENGYPRTIDYLAYPANYGMIPQTLSPTQSGGDGDPLDVFVLGAALEQGSIVRCKLIGVIKMLDRQEQDDKLIAVTENSPFTHFESLDQLNEQYPGVITILSTWLSNYKGSGKVVIEEISNASEAKIILHEAMHAYKNNRILE